MPETLLLDTNIWLDSYLGNRPHHREVLRLMTMAISDGVELLYAVTSIKDVFYKVAASLKQTAREARNGELSNTDGKAANAAALGCINNMTQIATAVGVNTSDVWLALKLSRVHTDFEDDLIIAAAQRAQADYLVTNDRLLLRHAPVNALSSADMLNHLEMCEQARQAIAGIGPEGKLLATS